MTDIGTTAYTVTTNSIVFVTQYSNSGSNCYGTWFVNDKSIIPTAGNNVSGNNVTFICRAGDKIRFSMTGGSSSILACRLTEIPIIS